MHRVIFLLVVTLVATTMTVGCRRGPEKRPLTYDATFSLNVKRVPAFWPRERFDWPRNEMEREAHKEAWATYGTPDFIRHVRTFDRRIVRPVEMEERHVLAGARNRPLIQWIYLDKELVLEFDGPRVEELDLDDKLRTVCIYGDPNDIRTFDREHFKQTSFYYYNHGQEFIFVDGTLIRTEPLGRAIHGAIEFR